jgi:hypothetical protein
VNNVIIPYAEDILLCFTKPIRQSRDLANDSVMMMCPH